MSNSSLSIAASMSTASQVGEDGCVVAGCEGLSTFFGDLQHQGIHLARHLNLLQQKLHMITINTARMKVGIPNICLDPNSYILVGELVFASMESNLAIAGPKSVNKMYCANTFVSSSHKAVM